MAWHDDLYPKRTHCTRRVTVFHFMPSCFFLLLPLMLYSLQSFLFSLFARFQLHLRALIFISSLFVSASTHACVRECECGNLLISCQRNTYDGYVCNSTHLFVRCVVVVAACQWGEYPLHMQILVPHFMHAHSMQEGISRKE